MRSILRISRDFSGKTGEAITFAPGETLARVYLKAPNEELANRVAKAFDVREGAPRTQKPLVLDRIEAG